MKKHKTINLPKVSNDCEKKIILPFNGNLVTEKHFTFSFACFDRTHKYFNLGNDKEKEKIVSSTWFVDLLDCLKDVSNTDIPALKNSIHDLHPVDWSNANTKAPMNGEQLDYWQFRLNKSKGRVIGFKIDSVFYIVWLDPHHNLTDSPHYEKAKSHYPAMSTYEKQKMEIEYLTEQLNQLTK